MYQVKSAHTAEVRLYIPCLFPPVFVCASVHGGFSTGGLWSGGLCLGALCMGLLN